MRIHLRSDIHLVVNKGFEQPPFPKDADVYVIAGDIEDHTYPATVARENPDKHVVVVLGNHDYWYAKGPDAYRDPTLPNLHVLEKQSVTINGFRFIGCTLWGKGPDDAYDARQMRKRLNDFNRIHSLKNDPWTMRDWNIQSKQWLEDQINNDPNHENIVVVTHFPPVFGEGEHHDVIDYVYYNGGVDVSALKPIAMWLHGHTHEVQLEDVTKPITNALGYMKYNAPHGFDPNFVLSCEEEP